jgi:hypothetical protein
MHVTTLGIDLAKSVFQLHGVDAKGAVVLQKKLRRGAVLDFLSKLEPCLVGMEACATSHHWAREVAALGHKVRLIPPAYVKPYVKRQKNDAADAEAICETVTRPNMRFVPVKTEDQQSVLVLHRSRDLLMRQRTMILNAIRAHLAEFGIIAPQAPRNVMEMVVRLRAGEETGLPEIARSALLALATQLDNLGGGDPQARAPADGLASPGCDQPAPRDHPRRRAPHRHGHRRQRPRSIRVQIRPAVRGVSRPRSPTEFLRRQGAARRNLQDGQRLSQTAARRRRHIRRSSRRDQRHQNGTLGAISLGAQARPRRHRGDGQQDRADRLGGPGAWWELPARADGVSRSEAGGRAAPHRPARANVDDYDRTGPQPGHPEGLSGPQSSGF